MHWSDELRETGQGAPIKRQGFRQWVSWGRPGKVLPVVFAVAGEVDVPFEQMIDAKFSHPIGWLIAFSVAMTPAVPAFPDTVAFFGAVQAGLGSGNFPGVFPAGILSGASLGPTITVVGPVPAETLVVSGFARCTAAGGLFPRTSHVTMGAFVAPQVWPPDADDA